MKFQTFCNLLTPSYLITEPLTDTDVLPEGSEEMLKRAHTLISQMAPKMGHLDSIEIPYIEQKLSANASKLEDILAGYNNGDVPNYLVNLFSTGLYAREFHTLNCEEQAIIRVLCAYIIVSAQEI